jgi:hypothetical protein
VSSASSSSVAIPAATITGEALDDAGGKKRAVRIVGAEIPLESEGVDVGQARVAQQTPKLGTDDRVRTGVPERRHHPVPRGVEQRRRWLTACRSKVEIDHQHQSAVGETLQVMAEHFGRVWEVEQDQPANYRVERPHVAEDSNVGLHEMNVAGTGSDSSLLGDGEERSGLIDPDDLTRCADELAENKRHMAQAGAQIEHPHPDRDTGAAQEEGRRRGDAGGPGRPTEPVRLPTSPASKTAPRS